MLALVFAPFLLDSTQHLLLLHCTLAWKPIRFLTRLLLNGRAVRNILGDLPPAEAKNSRGGSWERKNQSFKDGGVSGSPSPPH